MSNLPNLRPMTIGDLLDAAFRLYRSHFVTFIGIAALLQVPMLIVQALAQYLLAGRALIDIARFSSSPPVVAPGQNPLSVLPVASFVTLYAVSLLLGLVQYLVVYNLITGALSKAISQSYMGQTISILGSYAIGWRRFFSLVAASLVPYLASLLLLVPVIGIIAAVFVSATGSAEPSVPLAIVLVLGMIGLIVAISIGIFVVYVRFLLTTQAIVLEDLGPLHALGRSWNLTRGSFWRTLGLIILMGIVVYIVAGIPASGVSLALQLTARNVDAIVRGQIITLILSQIGLILALPLQFAVYTLLYYDIRIRREGYDLELKAQQTALA